MRRYDAAICLAAVLGLAAHGGAAAPGPSPAAAPWEDVNGRPDIVGIQDYVSQVGQGVFADREAERLGKSDVGIIILRRLWSAEPWALAEGKPVRQWRRPEHVKPVPGAA